MTMSTEWKEEWKKHKIFLEAVLKEIGKKHFDRSRVLAELEQTKKIIASND